MNGKPRRILPRTYRCYGEENIKKALAASEKFYTNLAAERDKERDSLGKDPETPVVNPIGMGNSLRGEAPKRRSPSPCSCDLCETVANPSYFSVRFHLPEAWQLSRVQISEGKCQVCGQERRLRDLRRVSRRLFVGPQDEQDLWEDSHNGDEWEESRRDQSDGPRILSPEQEEDRGLRSLACQEEMPTLEDLDEFYSLRIDEPIYIDADDSPVVEQQHTSGETETSERLMDLGEDWTRKDYFDEYAGELLSDLYDA